MYKSKNNLFFSYLKNPNNLLLIIFCLMSTLVALKMLSIFFLTMRGVGLGWPFNSYLFDPFHRFTDWLIPYAWAHSNNPWDVNGELIKSLPASPYGPITFYYMKIMSFTGKIFSFFFLVIYFMVFLFKIVNYFYWKNGKPSVYLISLMLIIFSYPFHFIIDRGNADILAAAIITHLIYNILKSEDFNKNFILICTIGIVGSKPSWIPFLGLLLLPIDYKFFLKGIFLITLVYISPLLFYDFQLTDYRDSIFKALEIMNGTIHFSNHLGAVFQWYSGGNQIFKFVLLALGGFLSILTLAVFNRKVFFKSLSFENKKIIFLLYIMLISFLVLLFNDPSPDYRLIILIPYLIILPNILQNIGGRELNTFIIYFLAIFLSIILSWSVYYLKSGFPITSPMRAVLLFICCCMTLFLALRNDIFDKKKF